WDSWRLGMLEQVSFALEGRVRDVESMRRLWTSTATLPSSFVTIATSFHPPDLGREHQGVWMRAIVRVAFDQEMGQDSADQLARTAADCGVRLWRCDGQQA